MKCGHLEDLFSGFVLLVTVQTVVSMVIPNATHLEAILEKYMDKDETWWQSKSRGKRAISQSDMQLILDLHNKLRGQVYPPASNMEYMVWDTELERSAEHWAHTCLWEHGPSHLLTRIGQNLGAHWGRDRPPTFHVQAWYDEVRDFSYPYPQECNPHCPYRCSGPVCTHYTQLVWATSNKIGCAINVCYNMNVWGMIWAKAVYLVCNYSPPGNWWGHAPYKHGTPCSACPPSYGGGCRNNLCYKDDGSNYHYTPETEENNYIEPEPEPVRSHDAHYRDETTTPSPNENIERNEVSSTSQMSQQVACDTRLRDQCKGTTCNRYECPPGCFYNYGKVIGSGHYADNSSICRAAIHAGVIQSDSGGYVDVMPVDKRKQHKGSYQNGISSESLQNPPGGKAFRVFAVI
ncbi:cysteine-rich secretory protein LCCL domain-containing 1b [Danio rerio]|uniref:Cysteine-rich secretory protein LCCL domain containing 1 n=1 Tax=Danio rerio TaxID=7955 RepID=Q7SY04_DANRE|nr:cysteine-rich secretory protein LCCL domain-containing 1b [Danio rerio]AAH55176.1 Cysteine-rich secretory protein LCCL domain containing 1 [Danio rerio]|eukprot:NP_956764.1 cysteine-rich secretory protein LCCL domain-containing 1 [Danio rerio]